MLTTKKHPPGVRTVAVQVLQDGPSEDQTEVPKRPTPLQRDNEPNEAFQVHHRPERQEAIRRHA